MKRVLIFILCLHGIVWSQNGEIKGRVSNLLTNEPLEFATIQIPSLGMGGFTDSIGTFSFKGLEPGLYNVEARYTGFKPLTKFEIQVTNSRPSVVDFELESEESLIDEVQIVASPFNRTAESPVSIRTIGVNEIQRNPGGNRDISRVIQSLPGVASSVGFRNDIIIRGGAPNENRFYIDGIEIPNINHFSTQGASGGPVGLLNVDFIREVDLITGAFPVNTGNALSSVMNLKLKNGRDDRLGFTATVGTSDIGLTVEGPIGKKTTFLASTRRSYLQLLFKALGLPFLPTYNDFQFKTKTKFDDKNELTVLGLGAIDNFALNLEADSTESQRYILGNLPVNTQWSYSLGLKYRRFTENGFWTVIASRNMLNNKFIKYEGNDDSNPDNLLLDYISQESENKFRVENISRFQGFKLITGVNYDYARFTNDTYNKIYTALGPQTIDFSSRLLLHKYGIFGNLSRDLLDDRMSISVGFRMDGNNFSKEMSNPLKQFSPRFSLSYYALPKLSFSMNAGVYYQLPPYTVLGYRNQQGSLVNKINKIKYIESRQLIGGAEYSYSGSGKITAEGFYKKYLDYPFLLGDGISLANLGGDFGTIGSESTNSKSKGRSYGMEFMVQQKLWKGFFGIASYTWVKSEFTDGTYKYKPSAWDNGHIVSLTAGKKFKWNWEIGAKWRYYGAGPYTPVDMELSSLKSVWDIRNQGLRDYSLLNSQRLQPSHNLDLRIDKKWFFKKWSLNLYFDLQNAYNFQTQQAPYVDVVRDEAGNPMSDPNDPSRYKLKLIDNTSGTLLPSIGIVVQL